MKLSVKLLLIYVVLTFALTAVALLWAKNHIVKSFDAIEASMDDIQERTFTTEGLKVLKIDGPFDVVYHQGKGQSKISGPAILLDKFDLSISQGKPVEKGVQIKDGVISEEGSIVNDGVFSVSTKSEIVPKGVRVSIDVYGEKVYKMLFNKNVNFRSADSLQLSDVFTLQHNGGGEVEFTHKPVAQIKISANGVSDIALHGKTQALDVYLNGASSAHLTGLVANTGKVSINGSSEASVHVTENLEIRATGASDVDYVDTGASVKTDVNGAARVNKIALDAINAEPAPSESDR